MTRLPGTRLLAFARLWFDESTIVGVFEPLVADWQRDCGEARPMFRWILHYLAGAAAFLVSALRCAPEFLRAAPETALRHRIVLALGVFMVLGIAVNLWTLDWFASVRTYPRGSWPFLMPSLGVASAPYVLLPLALLIRAQSTDLRQARRLLLVFTSMTVIIVIVAGGWLVPAANQTWRTIIAEWDAGGHTIASPSLTPRGRVLARGANELTNWELYSPSAWASDVYAPRSQVRIARHDRLQFALLPAILAFLGWRLGAVSRRIPVARAIAWWSVVCVTVLALRTMPMLSQTPGWPEAVLVWLPLLLFAAAAMAARPNAQILDHQIFRSSD